MEPSLAAALGVIVGAMGGITGAVIGFGILANRSNRAYVRNQTRLSAPERKLNRKVVRNKVDMLVGHAMTGFEIYEDTDYTHHVCEFDNGLSFHVYNVHGHMAAEVEATRPNHMYGHNGEVL